MFWSNVKQIKHMNIIFNHIADMVFFMSVDKDGVFRYEVANESAMRQKHLPKDYIGKSIKDVMPEDIAESIIRNYDKAIREGRMVTFIDQIESADGTCRWYESNVTPVFNKHGRCEQIIAVARNITERIEQEEELRRTQKELELIFNHASDAVFTFDENGDYLRVNPGFTRLFGWTQEELLADKSITILPEGTSDDFKDILQSIKAGKNVYNHESSRVTKTGELIHVLASYSLMRVDDQIIGGVAMYKDITEMKHIEIKLRESEERFRHIADYSSDLIRVVDPEGMTLYASPSHKEFFGLSPEFFINKSCLTLIHPKDMNTVKETLEIISRTKMTQTVEYRRFNTNKEPIWLEGLGTPIMNEQGKVHQILFITRDIRVRKKQETKLRHLAFHDTLTNLPNRRLFNTEVIKAMRDVRRTKKVMATFVLDCDNFKWINDTYGHGMGDKVIQQFAKRIENNLRGGSMVSRMGGDEFQVVLPDLDKEEDAVDVARRIVKTMEVPFIIGEQRLQMSASIGISFYHGDKKNKETLLKEADSALYTAKRQGKNTYSIYQEEPTRSLWRTLKRLFFLCLKGS